MRPENRKKQGEEWRKELDRMQKKAHDELQKPIFAGVYRFHFLFFASIPKVTLSRTVTTRWRKDRRQTAYEC